MQCHACECGHPGESRRSLRVRGIPALAGMTETSTCPHLFRDTTRFYLETTELPSADDSWRPVPVHLGKAMEAEDDDNRWRREGDGGHLDEDVVSREYTSRKEQALKRLFSEGVVLCVIGVLLFFGVSACNRDAESGASLTDEIRSQMALVYSASAGDTLGIQEALDEGATPNE